MNPGHAVIGVLTGLVLLGLPLSIIATFASLRTAGSNSFFYAWGAAALIGGVLGLCASRPAKIFRYVFIFGAIAILLLPLATCIGPTIAMADKGDTALVAGAAIGAGLGSMVIGFFAFFVAAAYLIVGLLIGRDKTPTVATIPATPAPVTPPAPAISEQPVPDHYATLGVLRNTSQHEIDEAAKRSIDTVRAAMTAHDPDATERFARLRVAMDVLRDPIRRATYDTDLLAEQLRAEKTS